MFHESRNQPDIDPGDIAVIGMSGRFPGAADLSQYWRNLRDGVESITWFDDDDLAAHVSAEDLQDPAYVRAGAVLDDEDMFDARFFGYSGREAALLDPQHRVLLECAWHAMEDAGHRPGDHRTTTGVYAGCSMSGYLLSNLLPAQPLDASAAGFELLIANDKDYLASRIGYQLDLSGPAVSVQTACSSSLVAIHTACQALLSFECDLALAGGATVRVPQRRGYLHEEGMILSPDGRCRPFDADANGTVGGNGVGMVVLKRLSEAIADGDRIDAVVKGTAVNNDGADKVGYTAPSMNGQAAAVATALGIAQIDGGTVSAIEAHGTGTALGDPIEIAALRSAFRDTTAAPASCAIGSVKGNIGHLDSAAGVAGFIKAVLQLRHRQLAPSINFGTANPDIDFAGGPFYVGTELRDWNPDGPRRIGVSSFGFGGTNAHVVLEEGPARAPSAPGRRALQLLPVSARSREALDAGSADLATALDDRAALGAPSLGAAALADVAHTLQTGRQAMTHRRIVLADSAQAAARSLRGSDPAAVATHTATAGAGVAFLFPGQGSQYPNMGRELYEDEPVFRAVVDRCAELLRPDIGLDLREVLYPGGRDASSLAAAAQRLQQTALAQPGLFTVEYALAELLTEWGVAPVAMLGHSVGEITAACVAGVLDLPTALHMVAVRGRLMQGLPTGSMLSVALGEEELGAVLPDALALAAVNAPDLCVVAGPDDDVEAFARTMGEREVGIRRLHTSHAFHSAMVDPMLEEFARELAGVRAQPPRVPYLSNRSGDWMSDGDALDPRYWTGHARGTVRYADAVDTLLDRPDLLLVELGPGSTLTALTKANPAARGRVAVSTLAGPDEDRSAVETVLAAVGRLWTAGAELDWAALHDGTPRHRVSLPSYRFQRRRYWIEAPGVSGRAKAALDLTGEFADDEPTEQATPSSDLDPRPELMTAYREPGTAVERRLAGIWRDLLGIEPVGVDDGFVELGGHSLMAVQVVGEIKKALGVTVPMRELLRASTVGALAELVAAQGVGEVAAGRNIIGDAQADAGRTLAAAVPRPAERHEPFPLTDIQQAQWVGRLGNFTMGNVAAHIYWEVQSAHIDVDRLERCWNVLVRRHPMLDAVLTADGRQRILPDQGEYRIERVDLRTADAATAEAHLDALRDRLSHEMRPTDTWPLYAIAAVLLPTGAVRVFLSFDLLIADIGSIRILLQEWHALYDDPDTELPEVGLSYRDYVLAAAKVRDTTAHAESMAYWRTRIEALPPAPDLPLAVSPEDVIAPRFVPRSDVLPTEQWLRVKQYAASYGVTASAVLLSAFAVVLGAWTRSSRFTLNTTMINRLPVHPDVGRLVGEFASFDLLPVDLTAHPSVLGLARDLQEQAWEDLEHRFVNGVEILREMARMRGGNASSVMPVVFTSTIVQEGEALFDWLGDIEYESVQTPQVWLDAAVLESSNGLYVAWPAVDELFPPGVVDEMFGAYCALLHELGSDRDLWTTDIGSRVPAEQRELVADVNDTAGEVPDGLLHDGIVGWALRGPQRPAVVDQHGALGYGALHDHAAALATRLRAAGAGPNRLVGVAVEKGRAQIVAALGVLLSGGAYLPIDPALPEGRQDHLVDHAGAAIVVEAAGGPRRNWPDGAEVVTVDLDETVERVTVAVEQPQSPTDLAYVIYTSGSTGQPKGVAVAHRAALNTCVDMNERFGVTADDVVLGLSSLSFDLSVYDVFGVLGAGGTLVLPAPGTSRDPAHWLELVTTHGVTLWDSVPALMAMSAEHVAGTGAAAESLRLVLMSGDWIPVDLPDAVRRIAPGADVVSLGGATEAAIWSIYHRIDAVDPTWDSIPYGRPLRNQSFHVLNDRWQECPAHVIGELYIGGIGLAEGYRNDPERTAASFVVHPATGERLYRTGDLGRRRPDGVIEFMGREDLQVKIGGFRIELGEIESVIARLDGVAAVVAAAPGRRHHRRLVAHVVPAGVRDPAADDDLVARVRAHAERHLPAYMVPPTIQVLDALPLSGNGKVDRSALPDPAEQQGERVPAADLGPLLATLTAIAAEVLGTGEIDPHANFFSVGGDSITGIQLVSRAAAAGMDITAADLFQAQTLADLAAVVARRDVGADASADAHLPLVGLQRELFDRADPDLPTAVQVVDLAVAPGFGPEDAQRVVALLLLRHSGLMVRFVRTDDGWRQVATRLDDDVLADASYVPLIDLSAVPPAQREAAMAQMIGEIGEELDATVGTLVRFTLFDLGGGDRRFVWVLHRLVADLPSLQILITEFGRAATQLRDADRADLIPPTRSFTRWAHAVTGASAKDSNAVDPVEDGVEDALPIGDGSGAVRRVDLVVPRAEAAALLADSASAYRLTATEVAVAALADALRAVGIERAVPVGLELDGRALGLADLDVSASAGAFAVVRGVVLDAAATPETPDLLAAVKDGVRAPGAGHPRPQVLVRDLDRLAQRPKVDFPFVPTAPPAPPRIDPGGAGSHPLVLTVYLLDGDWHLDWLCRGEEAAALAESLAEPIQRALRSIAEHCADPASGTVSVNDFPLAGVDDDGLSALLSRLTGGRTNHAATNPEVNP